MTSKHGSDQSHEEITSLFSDYYDDELSPEDRAELDDHLRDCPACASELEDFKRTLDALKGFGTATAPADFLKDVTSTINRQSRGAFFRDTWIMGFRLPYEAFFALLLALLAGIYVFAPGSQVTHLEDASGGVDELPERAPTTNGEGEGLGTLATEIPVVLASDLDLGAVARGLRIYGYPVRPAVVDGQDALVVSLAMSDLEGFAAHLHKIAAVRPVDLLSKVPPTGHKAVTIRFTAAPPP